MNLPHKNVFPSLLQICNSERQKCSLGITQVRTDAENLCTTLHVYMKFLFHCFGFGEVRTKKQSESQRLDHTSLPTWGSSITAQTYIDRKRRAFNCM